ncbi:MAG: hypothetical protein KDA41_20350, partial [Planctomycetales bacterium]|nr:hypothetical protein [Planctomycetales bacterium]
ADQTWDDYERDRVTATDHVVDALVGGGGIGHTRESISPPLARNFWLRFEAFITEPRHYYIGMGLGNQDRVFLHGAVIVGRDVAGLLWIAEDD